MILVIDASERDQALFGSVEGRKLTATFVPHADSPLDILQGAVQFLHRHGSTLADVRTVIAVAGPGRFSGLRLTSVFANTLQWSKGVRVRMIRGEVPGKTSQERVAFMLKHATPVRSAKPFYGKPPSITRPKRP